MTKADQWEENNARYLSGAVGRLRAMLERRINPPSDLAPPPPPPEPPRRRWRLFGGREVQAEAAPEPLAAAPPPAIADVDDLLPDAQLDPPPAMTVLAQRLGLSAFEQKILLLCAAVELDTRIGALCARAQKDPARPYPTFALALGLFSDPAWDAISPERSLRYWRLVEPTSSGAQPLTTSALRIDERILNYLKGLNYLDDRLSPLLAPLAPPAHRLDLPASQRATIDAILRRLQRSAGLEGLPVVQLIGPDAAGKQMIASRAAAAFGLHVQRLPLGLLPRQAAELETLARLWRRESLLLPLALFIDADDADPDADQARQAADRLLERLDGVVFFAARNFWPGLGRAALPLDVMAPKADEQKDLWSAALGANAGRLPETLSGQFTLDAASIERIAGAALSDADDDGALPDRLWRACLAATRPRIESLAERVNAKATWDDIVLPAAETSLLRQIADQAANRGTVYESWGFGAKRSRGLGISALFAGESGTGKTMAAEVIANHLRLDLYRIDLSAVVNKYIGETEKNLRRLFDAAEAGGCMLFFDEADALFGKRSEVKDSHDRLANIETNYLLQRMEAYRGLAILATNMKNALDPAFMRRIRFLVEFRFPGVEERKAIWRKVFPHERLADELDFDCLARLELTGGHIDNIALNAAFLAAAQGQSRITMPLILAAARAECRKAGQPINEADFRSAAAAGAVA